MGIRRGEITTKIVSDGLVFNMDPANRSCYPRTGTTTTDTVGNDSGTLNGTTFENINSGVFNFDGSDDYIDCGDTTYLNGVSQISLSIWFNLDAAAQNKGLIGDLSSFSTAATNGHFGIVTKNASGDDYSFRIYFIHPDGVEASINISDRPFTAGQWHNMVMTYNAGTVKFYADGTLVSSGIYDAANGIPTTLGSTAKPLDIGRYVSLEWDGKIACTQIYNRALSAEEVLRNYNGLRGRFGV